MSASTNRDDNALGAEHMRKIALALIMCSLVGPVHAEQRELSENEKAIIADNFKKPAMPVTGDVLGSKITLTHHWKKWNGSEYYCWDADTREYSKLGFPVGREGSVTIVTPYKYGTAHYVARVKTSDDGNIISSKIFLVVENDGSVGDTVGSAKYRLAAREVYEACTEGRMSDVDKTGLGLFGIVD